MFLRKHVITDGRMETISSEAHFINEPEWIILLHFYSHLICQMIKQVYCHSALNACCQKCLQQQPQDSNRATPKSPTARLPHIPILQGAVFSHRTKNLLIKNNTCTSTSSGIPEATEPISPFHYTFPIQAPLLIHRATLSMQVTLKPSTVM